MQNVPTILKNLYRARASKTTFRGQCPVCGKDSEQFDLYNPIPCGDDCHKLWGLASRYGGTGISPRDELKKIHDNPDNPLRKITRVSDEYPWSPADPDGSLRRSGVIKRYNRPPTIK